MTPLFLGQKYFGVRGSAPDGTNIDTLEIITEDPRWAPLNLEALAEKVLRPALADQGLDPDKAEISILACDDARITALNGDFRNKPTATNVLSWPAEERGAVVPGQPPHPVLPDPDGTLPLGDIAISYDTCAREAAAAARRIEDHVTHLILHGTLHLLGFDHITEADADLMETIEVKILGKLGIDDPYKVI